MVISKGDNNMDWVNDINRKLNNKVLFSKDHYVLKELNKLISKNNHRIMVLWAFDFVDETIQKIKKNYPNEVRPQIALDLSKDWAMGLVKMPIAKKAILNVHSFAKEITSEEDVALCHAIGQGCGVVHGKGHAIGFAIYDLTAIIRHYGINDCKMLVEERIKQYIDRIYYWNKHYLQNDNKWTKFMYKD
jgi:hypothetical protein